MKKLFAFIIFLLCTPTTQTAAALQEHEIPLYVNLERAAEISKTAKNQCPYESFLAALNTAMVLQSTTMSNQKKLNAIDDKLYWQEIKAIIEHMVSNGINPNTITYKDSKTPLIHNIKHRDIFFTHYLLRHGANPSLVETFIGTPLEYIVGRLNYETSFNPTYLSGGRPTDIGLLKLLIFNNANLDYIRPGSNNRSIRENANPDVRMLIEQTEQEKSTSEFLAVLAHLPKEDVAQLAINYLYPQFQATPKEITQAAVSMDDVKSIVRKKIRRAHTVAKNKRPRKK